MNAVWVIALAAGAVQTVRFALQKQLKGTGLSTGGATFSRFVFAAPLALIVSLATLWITKADLPTPTARFWMFVVTGGLGQILATMATVALFSARNFAVGIAFTKTETLLVALFSFVFLGEAVSSNGLIAILVGMVGVIILSWTPGVGRLSLFNRASALGLAAGALFGLAAISYRGASLELVPASPFLRASLTLTAVTTFQTLAMMSYLRWREPMELTRTLSRWRETSLVGLTGMLGSLGWFLAFSLMNAAYVRAIGQVELVFSLLMSWFIFKDRSTGREILGMALLLVSIVGLILLA